MINSTITPLACIYGAAMLVFTGAFLIDWIRLRKKIRIYLEYGIWIGLAIVGLQMLVVSITPSALASLSIFTVVIQSIIVFIRAVGFTMLGMYYCTSLGYPSFPLLLRKFGVSNDEGQYTPPLTSEGNDQAMTGDVDSGQQMERASSGASHPEKMLVPTSMEAAPILLDVNRKKYFATIMAAAGAGIIYSIGLFLLTKPHLSEAVQRSLGTTSLETVNVVTVQSILLVLAATVGEEVFFRVGIQSYLAKYLRLKDGKYWLAILITTVIWSSGHVGTLDPDWVKLAQVFPLGLMLGWLFKMYGAESSVLAHGLFNLILLFPSKYLIT